MGCVWLKSSSSKESLQDIPKVYSWDKRNREEIMKLNFVNLENKTIISRPNEASNEQFIMQNCHNCTIYALNYISAVTIDDCTKCKIFLGPTHSSVFIRDTSDCQIAVATRQFRLRDCKRLDVFLYVSTQPIIESSIDINFSCYQANYPQLREQFEAASLCIYNNNWHDVYDFTSVPGEKKNFNLLPENVNISDYFSNIEEIKDFKIDRNTSYIYFTHPLNYAISDENCFVAFFSSPFTKRQIDKFIHLMQNKECVLVQSKEFKISDFDAKKIFGIEYLLEIEKGPVAGLEWKGKVGLYKDCLWIAEEVKTEYPGSPIFIRSTESFPHIKYFFELAQMMLQSV